jgi:hypothetical protein
MKDDYKLSNPVIDFNDVLTSHGETELRPHDLALCLKELPSGIFETLKDRKCCVAGGFIRDIVAGIDKPKDIDIFTDSEASARIIADRLLERAPYRGLIVETDRALTVVNGYRRPEPQVIYRWVFDDMSKVIDAFDFTICQAAFWWDNTKFVSRCAPTFYDDVPAQDLVYTSPGNNDSLSSICRLLKFTSRGHRINDHNLGALLADFVASTSGETLKGSGIRESLEARLLNCNHGKS